MDFFSTTVVVQVPRKADLYDVWSRSHSGTEDDFFRFMTTPTTERSRFIEGMPVSTHWLDSILIKEVRS